MDHVGPDVEEVGDELPDGDGVVRLVDDADVETFALELSNRAAGRE
jgi:hypothetical protein